MAMISSYYEESSSYLNAEILGIQLSVLVGPLWGGLLFNLLGYTGIFAAQSVMLLFSGLLVCYFRGHERAHPLIQIQSADTLGYCAIIKSPVISVNFRVCSLGS